MSIVLYVKHIWCSGIPYIYGQLEWRAFCYMWNVFGVVVFQRSMVNWRGDACPRYMSILLHAKLIQCWWCSIDLFSIRGGRFRHLSSVCTSFENMSSLHHTGLFYKRSITQQQQQQQHTDRHIYINCSIFLWSLVIWLLLLLCNVVVVVIIHL